MRALEAEMERITVDDVLIQTIVTLLNLAARKAGLAAPPGQGPAPDWEQVRQAIDGARALVPLLEQRHARPARADPRHAVPAADDLRAARRRRGAADADAQPGGPVPQPGGRAGRRPAGARQAGPAQRSGRLWIPGQ